MTTKAELKRKLTRGANKKGLTGKRRGAYIYGTLRRIFRLKRRKKR